MDNQGNFREQSLTNMQKAVYAGEMTVADYYERQVELRAAEQNGVDDGSSCTKGENSGIPPQFTLSTKVIHEAALPHYISIKLELHARLVC